jgi:hypothetical protein
MAHADPRDAARQLFVQDFFTDLKHLQCVIPAECLKVIADYAVEDRSVYCTVAERNSFGMSDPLFGVHWTCLTQTVGELLWFCRCIVTLTDEACGWKTSFPEMKLLVDVPERFTQRGFTFQGDELLVTPDLHIGALLHSAGCTWEELLAPSGAHIAPKLAIMRNDTHSGTIVMWLMPKARLPFCPPMFCPNARQNTRHTHEHDTQTQT